jgi:hypothetical protein
MQGKGVTACLAAWVLLLLFTSSMLSMDVRCCGSTEAVSKAAAAAAAAASLGMPDGNREEGRA